MDIQENIPLANKTTMRIGGSALYYAEISTKEDVEQAYEFAQEKDLPLITLGGGSNTIFSDDTINALVVRIKADEMEIDGNLITIKAGKNLPMLINELAEKGFDLSPLTGIPGTVGGAILMLLVTMLAGERAPWIVEKLSAAKGSNTSMSLSVDQIFDRDIDINEIDKEKFL